MQAEWPMVLPPAREGIGRDVENAGMRDNSFELWKYDSLAVVIAVPVIRRGRSN